MEKDYELKHKKFGEVEGIWHDISGCGCLTEKFIKKYSDKLDWRIISKNQELSESFIIENISKLDIGTIAELNEPTKELVDFILKYEKESPDYGKSFITERMYDRFILNCYLYPKLSGYITEFYKDRFYQAVSNRVFSVDWDF